MDRFLEKGLGKLVPGLFVAVELVEWILDRLGHAEERYASLLFVLSFGAIAWLTGNWWDSVLFDPLLSVASSDESKLKRAWRWVLTPLRSIVALWRPAEHLESARNGLAEELNKKRAGQGDYMGLYETAMHLCLTEKWREKNEWRMELSKTCRTFLIPLLALMLYRAIATAQPWPFSDMLLRRAWWWPWDLALFLGFLGGYIYLRASYMTTLYESARKVNFKREDDGTVVMVRLSNWQVPYLPDAGPRQSSRDAASVAAPV